MSFTDDFPDAGFRRRTGPTPGRFNGAPGGPPCPTCGSRNSAVTDSRPIETSGGGQKRRRKCLSSDKCPRWNTFETNIDPATLEKPKLSKLDQSRVTRIIETADALRKSLDIPK